MFAPDFANATGLLKHLNSEELKGLLNDDEKLGNMIKDLKQVKEIAAEKEILLASNRSLAEYNLSLKPILEQKREELFLMYNQLSEMKSKVVDKKKQCNDIKFQKNPDVILALLQTAAAEAEEESEACVEELLSNKVQIIKFLDDYLPKRAHSHVLRTKSEKMMLILQQEKSCNSSLVTPPQKPIRTRKAPLPPTASTNISPSEPKTFLPTRYAPLPPVQIPRRQSNPINDFSRNMSQLSLTNQSTPPYPTQNPPPVFGQPVFPISQYPQYVRMPLPN